MNTRKRQDQQQSKMAHPQQQNSRQPHVPKNNQNNPRHEHECPELRMTD